MGIILVLNLIIVGLSQSSGSTLSVKLRALLISFDASSRFVPYSKFIKTTDVASLEVEVISLSLLTEFRAFSRGLVTFDSISDALAPDKLYKPQQRAIPSRDKDPPVIA